MGISLLTELQAKVVSHQFYGSDQFFSGHTGMPFLGPLCFWHMQQWRYFYLAVTVFFGAVVLLGHYHYSIDVLAALFITYGIFQIACWMFRQDFALFRSSELAAAKKPKRAIRKKIDTWVKARRKGRCWCGDTEAAARAVQAAGRRRPVAACGVRNRADALCNRDRKADANYSAYVPDVPGCVATGDTVAAVEREKNWLDC